MRKSIGLFAAAALVVAASTSWAGDKSGEAFVDTSSLAGGSNGFTNGISTNLVYSTGASKSAACKIKVQFKGLTGLADGAELICIGSADVKASIFPAGAGNSALLTAVWDQLTGKALGKADLRRVAGGVGCGSLDAINYDNDMDCYLPDAGYDPATQCATDGALWVAAAAESTDNFLGICQGGAPGFRITPPGSGLLASQGATQPMK